MICARQSGEARWVILLLAAVGIFSSCSHPPAEPLHADDTAPVVAVAKVTRTDLASNVVLTAEFEPFQEVDVMAKVSGYIRKINVDIGDHVHEGQLLATLEVPEMQDDLNRGQASIDEASAELATARDELQRAEASRQMTQLSYSRILDVSKREPGLVPQQEVDEANSRDLVAQAQVSSARSHVAACQQRIRVSESERARLKTLFQYSTIDAPFAGVITKRYANIGSLIQAGTASQTQAMPVVRLSQNGLLRLALPVPESDVPLVRLGAQVDVRVSALHRTFPGQVARFADRVDQATRTMKTEVDVSNATFELVPGMYAEVDLVTEQHKSVLSIPVEAIDGSGDATRVFSVRKSGVVQIVPVRTGIETAHRIELLSGDLQDGDEVVVGSRAGLKNGNKVEPKVIELAGN
jgi:RND family efflux transporter MFP subunit